jgi:hypothetical protein
MGVRRTLKLKPPDTAVRVDRAAYLSEKAEPSHTTSWMLAPGKLAKTIVLCNDGEDVIVKATLVPDGMTVEAAGATDESTGVDINYLPM